MKSKAMNFWIVAAAALGTALSVSACGKIKEKGEPAAGKPANAPAGDQQVNNSAALLRPFVREESEANFAVPGDEGPKNELAVAQDGVLFKEVIVYRFDEKLKRVKDLFLVWTEATLGPKIVDAYYLVEKRDPLNKKTGTLERRTVHQDKDRGRWFIPIKEMLGGDTRNGDPSEMHSLTLELHLEDRSVVNLKVSLWVNGSLPNLEVKERRGTKFGSAGELIRGVGNSEWVLSDSYFNPSGRNVTVWLKDHASPLSLVIPLLEQSWQNATPGTYRRATIVPKSTVWRIAVPLELTDVAVGFPREQRRLTEFPKRTPSGWYTVELGPFENMTIGYTYAPARAQPGCTMPGNTEIVFTWQELKHKCVRGECSDEVVTRSEKRTGTWSLQGSVAITGKLKRSLYVTAPYASEKDVDERTASHVLVQDDGAEVPFVDPSWGSAWNYYPCPGMLWI